MAVKIENEYAGKLPRGTLSNIESALESVPREHLRGIEIRRVRHGARRSAVVHAAVAHVRVRRRGGDDDLVSAPAEGQSKDRAPLGG